MYLIFWLKVWNNHADTMDMDDTPKQSDTMTPLVAVESRDGDPQRSNSAAIAVWLSLSPKQRHYILTNYLDSDDGR